jgi:hypothetical protein
VDVFVRWSSAGAPAGDPADAPAPPGATPGLVREDAILDPGDAYVPNASVTDDYRCFVLPWPGAVGLPKDLIGFEVVPGTPSQVHHVILFSIPQSIAQNLDANEAGPGWTCYGGPGVPRAQQAQVTMLGGWVPGTGATQYPDGTGINVPAGDVVVMQVHYNMSHGAPVADRTQVKLEFASKPVLSALIIPFTNDTFSIPPGASGYVDEANVPLSTFLPFARVWGVTPHMHEKGRRIRVWRTSPETCLIDVPNWDFHWQQPYAYATPIQVRGGESFTIECTWDNPTNATVTWGERTTDEMCIAFFYVTVP